MHFVKRILILFYFTIEKKIIRKMILTKNRELRRFGIIAQIISFFFYSENTCFDFASLITRLVNDLACYMIKKERLQRKAGIGTHFSMVRGFGFLLQMQMHAYREVSTTQEKRAFLTNRAKGQFVSIRFNYHNYICSIMGLWVNAPISIRRNRIRYLQMWLPPRRFTTSTRRNGCPGSILFLVFCD